jgi:hypothetical protein
MEAELPPRTVTRSDGTVTEYGGGPDWQARLRATEQLDQMLGLRATGVSEDADVNAAVSAISVHLHVPGNGQAPAAEAKPAAKPRYLRGVAPRAIGGNGHSA